MHLANRKQITGKKLIEWQTWFLRGQTFPTLSISGKFIFLYNSTGFGFALLRYHLIRESLKRYPKFSMTHPESCLIPVWQDLKLVSAIFYQIFIFSPNDSPLKTMKKCFLFHRKSSFLFRDFQIFVIFSLPFRTFQIQKGKWRSNDLWCPEMICINLQM